GPGAAWGPPDRLARSSGAMGRHTPGRSIPMLRLRPGAASAPPHPASRRGDARSPPILLVLDEDAQRRAVEIIKLPLAQRPEKGRKADETKSEGNGDQDEQAVHRAAPLSRSALPTTINEDPDMAMAATSGVT